MRQLSFASVEFDRFDKTTRRGAFLAEMEAVVPWKRLYELIEPFYASPARAAVRLGWSVCCGFIFYNTGLACLIRLRKSLSTILR